MSGIDSWNSSAWSRSTVSAEAQHHRFLFKLDAEFLVHCYLHCIAQRKKFRSRRTAEIHQGKGVARGDSDPAHGKTFLESGLFDQPCSGQLHHAIARRVAWHLFVTASAPISDLPQFCRRDNGIFEEGAGALAVRAALSGKHSLLLTDGPYGVVDLAERGFLTALDLRGEVALNIGVTQGGLALRPKRIGDRGDDVSPARLRVEEAATITEVAGFMVEIDETKGLKIVGPDLLNDLGNLLSIGANILNGGASDIAGNSRKALESGIASLDRIKDEAIPVFSGPCLEDNAVPFTALLLFGLGRDADNNSVKACIADQQVASSAKDEKG